MGIKMCKIEKRIICGINKTLDQIEKSKYDLKQNPNSDCLHRNMQYKFEQLNRWIKDYKRFLLGG